MPAVNLRRFGQFLHQRGFIDGPQLGRLLRESAAARSNPGDAAITAGLLAPEDVARIRFEQLRRKSDFGSVAVAMGVLGEDQLVQLECSGSDEPLIGRLLVESGMLDGYGLARARLEYMEASMARTVQVRMTFERARNPALAEASVETICTLYQCVTGRPLELALSGASLPIVEGSTVWSQDVRVGGDRHCLALQLDAPAARRIASLVLGPGVTDTCDGVAEGAVSDFLGILMGHICHELRDRVDVHADPPRVTRRDCLGGADGEAVVLECTGEDIVFHLALR